MRYLSQLRNPSGIAVALIIVLVASVGALQKDAFVSDILVYVMIWTGVAMAWNLTAGLAGRLSLGQSAFFGIGAYASTILYMQLGLTPWAGAMVGAATAAMAAAIIEVATVRLAGIYYSLATFAFSELLMLVSRGWRELTNGTIGLTIPFRPDLANMTFVGKQGYVWLAVGYAAICLLVTVVILTSRLGYSLKAQRDNPEAAASLGVNTNRVRLIAGVISGALTAIGGTVFAQYLLFIDPDVVFTWNISVQAALMSIIGGMGTIAGPLLGALLLVPLERILLATLGGQYGGLHMLVYGPVLVVAVLLIPSGLVPLVDRLASGLVRRTQRSDARPVEVRE